MNVATTKASPAGIDRLRRSAVLVCSLLNDRVVYHGTGAVISVRGASARIATAGHVFDLLEKERRAGGTPVVVFYGDLTVSRSSSKELVVQSAEVVGHAVHPGWLDRSNRSDACDLAILSVRSAQPLPCFPVRLAAALPRREAEIVMCGYPPLAESPALRVTAGWYEETLTDGRLLCHLSGLEGESGAPVIDRETGDLLGLYLGGEERPVTPVLSIARGYLVAAAVIAGLMRALDAALDRRQEGTS